MELNWHDLRKNPNDVPSGYYDVLVSAIIGNDGMQEEVVFISQWDTNRWTNCDSEIVIGWMDIPTPLK